MGSQKVIIVLLRRPRKYDPEEDRADPFWELGSFGITGCHKHNLMHLNNWELLNGTKLAFAQGGDEGFKLMYLTSPVKAKIHKTFCEAQWLNIKMPFKYKKAPILINNDGYSDFDLITSIFKKNKSRTFQQKFASSFRSRIRPLDEKVADQVISIYDLFNKKNDVRSTYYTEALPYEPPNPDYNRLNTYKYLVSEAKKYWKEKKCDNRYKKKSKKSGC